MTRAKPSGTNPPSDPAAGRINRADQDLLTFAINWLPFGGGHDDEIWVNFGMSRDRYMERLREIVEHHRPDINPDTAQRLIVLCNQHRRIHDQASAVRRRTKA